MTENVSDKTMEPFENPDLLPLENLKLKIQTGGVVQRVDALSEYWVNDRYFLHYEAPNIYDDNGHEIMGAKVQWIETVNYMISDLRWLLSLPFYRFWSNIIYNSSILDTLVSFLQEAPPFYALENFPNCAEMRSRLETLRRYVLVVFTRLVTNKQSNEEYMSLEFLGSLLYEKYIFTVPIIFDLCQLYGRENEKILKRMLGCLFTLEPRYNNDLHKTVPCLIQALENVEAKFESGSAHCANGAIPLSKRNTSSTKLTLFNLEDMILYVLDIVSTLTIFLKNYHPAVSIFHKEDFMTKIVSVYENTIPEMYKALAKLASDDQNMPKYMELKHRLDVTRIEILHLFRIIIYEPILNIQEKLDTITEAEIKKQVDEYLNLFLKAVSEKEFITDYVQFYPVKTDLNTLSNICSEIDTVKCDFILKSISATIEKPNALYTSNSTSAPSSNSIRARSTSNSTSVPSTSNCTNVPSTSNFTSANEAAAGPSGISNRTTASKDTDSSNNKRTTQKDAIELTCLLSKVQDILCDLDEQFIKMSLQYYDYNTEAVINAVLEDSLPPELKKLKDMRSIQEPSPPPSYQEAIYYEDKAHGFDAPNMSDNYDDVYVKPRHEVIEVAKDYITKNYSYVVDEYDDELDDTYDISDTHGLIRDDAAEVDSKPFTTPRVLLEKQKVETTYQSESEDEDVEADQNGKDHFIQNPEEVRARAEQRRQAMRGGKSAPNVTGKPKGRGQDDNVLQNRHVKNVHKGARANHNRRSGASFKRRQGMVPS